MLRRGDEHADELLSDWLEEATRGMTKLELVWSADALREAFDANEAQQVGYFLTSDGCWHEVRECFHMLMSYPLAALRGARLLGCRLVTCIRIPECDTLPSSSPGYGALPLQFDRTHTCSAFLS